MHHTHSQWYVDTVNIHFQFQALNLPVKLLDANNTPGILINNLCKEEDKACQRSPLDNDIFTKLHLAAKAFTLLILNNIHCLTLSC